MQSIFNYFKFKYDYLVSCINAFFVKEAIKNVEDKYQLHLTNEQIDKLTEMYIEYSKYANHDSVEDFVFFKLNYI